MLSGTFIMSHQNLALTKPIMVGLRELYRLVRGLRLLCSRTTAHLKNGHNHLNSKKDGISNAGIAGFVLAMLSGVVGLVIAKVVDRAGAAAVES